jgi:hypothetical protein
MAPNKLQKQIATLESNIHSGAVKTTYKTPNAIRTDLLTYKIKNELTQAQLADRVGVNPASFVHFLTYRYKDPMMAQQNRVYLTAARFLALEKAKEKVAALQAQLPHDKQADSKTHGDGRSGQCGAPAKRAKASDGGGESHSSVARA